MITAVEKVSQRIRLQNENERIRQLHQNTLHPNNPKIVPATGDRVEFVEVKNIIRCQGECNYTHLYFTDKKPLLVAKSLIEFEELLGEYDFIRVHKTHLISLNHVASFNRNNVGILVVSNGDHVSISRRRKDFTISQLKKVLKFS